MIATPPKPRNEKEAEIQKAVLLLTHQVMPSESDYKEIARIKAKHGLKNLKKYFYLSGIK